MILLTNQSTRIYADYLYTLSTRLFINLKIRKYCYVLLNKSIIRLRTCTAIMFSIILKIDINYKFLNFLFKQVHRAVDQIAKKKNNYSVSNSSDRFVKCVCISQSVVQAFLLRLFHETDTQKLEKIDENHFLAHQV